MFDEDMSAFFNSGEFAVVASFTPAGGSPVSANVLLDTKTQDIFGDDVLSNEYVITFPKNSLPGVRKGDTGTVDGVSYKVREVKFISDGSLKTALLTKV
jgi:hypothetical protein